MVYNRMYDKKKKNIFGMFCVIIFQYSRTSTSKMEKNMKNFRYFIYQLQKLKQKIKEKEKYELESKYIIKIIII